MFPINFKDIKYYFLCLITFVKFFNIIIGGDTLEEAFEQVARFFFFIIS